MNQFGDPQPSSVELLLKSLKSSCQREQASALSMLNAESPEQRAKMVLSLSLSFSLFFSLTFSLSVSFSPFSPYEDRIKKERV